MLTQLWGGLRCPGWGPAVPCLLGNVYTSAGQSKTGFTAAASAGEKKLLTQGNGIAQEAVEIM